ncbi:MAG: AAA family ATPase [Actinomycetota bacterium]|nr:AAA family ATPase [Actinomycetota bacterium]
MATPPQVWDPRASNHAHSLLKVVGERIAVLVAESRKPDDVPDDQRGHVFPLDLVIRDARDLEGVDSRVVVSDADLPEDLTRWAMLCGLSDAQMGALIVAAAVHIDPRFESFFIVLNNEVDTRGPSVATTLRLIGSDPSSPAARSIFDVDGFLRRMGLIELRRPDHPLPSRIVNASERFVRHFLGDGRFDSRAREFLTWRNELLIPGEILPDLAPFPDVRPLGSRQDSALICLRAHQGSGALCIAHHRLRMAGHARVLLMDASDLPKDGVECSEVLQAVLREAGLACAPVVVDARQVPPDRVPEILSGLDQSFVPVIVVTGPSVTPDVASDRIVDVPAASPAIRAEWLEYLGQQLDNPRMVDTLQRLEPEEIRERLVHGNARMDRSYPSGMGTLARPVIPTFRLADLVLPEQVEEELSHLLGRVRLRDRVFDDWAMRPGGTRGRGITALFAGPSGTGKTMAAEALAGELGVPLFHVDLSSVVDKYIGETEKRLEQIFTSAEQSDGVLLFDEADALFGKRSQVSDARDRHANIEVAYLLQRMESFDGLAILTSNLRANLDDAFSRRLDCIVDFPEPTQDLRKRIWRACLGEQGRNISDDEFETLSTLELSGGGISSACISAAFAAAGAGCDVSFEHVTWGAAREWQKLGRLSFPLQQSLATLTDSSRGEANSSV